MVNAMRLRGAWLFYFSRYFVRHFVWQRGLQTASSLAYTTLLSLVPLFTVMIAFSDALPILGKFNTSVQAFIFKNFVPSFGDTVLQYLHGYSQNASKLTFTGLISLVVIALMLMATIDNALNTIWYVRKRRNRAARFLVYWAMLTLGPILVGVGLLSTSYLLSLPGVTGVNESLGPKGHLLSVLPFITTSAAFTLLYIVVPNCHVPYRHAVIGGILAAAVFEIAKFFFGIYVRSVPAEAIYGAIAVIPLFLIWLYTSWVVVLLGAHITFCLSEFRLHAARSGRGFQQWSFDDAYQLVAALWDAQKDGGYLSMRYLRRHGITMPQHKVNEIMEILRAARWVERTGSGDWILSRDLDDVTLLDLHRIIPRRLPLESELAGETNDRWLAELHAILNARLKVLTENLNVPLGSMLRQIREQSSSNGEISPYSFDNKSAGSLHGGTSPGDRQTD